MLGVISDVGFVVQRNDPSSMEKRDAGIDLCQLIKSDNPLMPFLLQSSQEEYRDVAKEQGVGFIQKNSKTLLLELNDFISREFAFGDFIFKEPATGEEVGRAKDLNQLQLLIEEIPDEVFEYHTSQNHLSKWLYSRGLFPIASSIRAMSRSNFNSIVEHRQALVNLIRDYRRLLGQGVIAKFEADTYSDAIAFARIGEGSLGGKARGLAFLNNMLQRHNEYNKYAGVRITIPRTVVVATDFFDQFIVENDLQYVIASEISDEDLLSEFISSRLPQELLVDLKAFIKTIRRPLAVRSSSKLEDSHYQPFAGIYSTYMIPYVTNEDQMLRLLGKAIKSVYASVFFSASRAYIATSANLISEEKMSVIIQDVCGTEEHGYYFPTLSGVARSINYYPIGDEQPSDGIVSIAMGLGKTVMEGGRSLRFSPRYPQQALQTSTAELSLKETQRELYVLSLRPEAFKTSIDDSVNFVKLNVSDVATFRNARYACSTWDRESEMISDAPMEQGYKVITFNNILKHNTMPLASIISDLMSKGEEEMRCPVEIEFAVNMDVPVGSQKLFNLLQIRPIIDTNSNHSLDWSQVDVSGALVYAEKALGVGAMGDISDIIYVKMGEFDNSTTEQIAEELMQLNAQMRDRGEGYILVGPGRWGSSDRFLGIPVGWGHISEARVIVECGLDNFRVEPSQGTHFFQNVTSLGVGYMTINPFMGDGTLDMARLDAMPAEYEGQFLRRVHFDKPLEVFVDGRNNKGVVKV